MLWDQSPGSAEFTPDGCARVLEFLTGKRSDIRSSYNVRTCAFLRNKLAHAQMRFGLVLVNLDEGYLPNSCILLTSSIVVIAFIFLIAHATLLTNTTVIDCHHYYYD